MAPAWDEAGWKTRWQAQRWFITADGEADKLGGNEPIRWHPDQGRLEVKLPVPLAYLANGPHGRYRLSYTVSFPLSGRRGGRPGRQRGAPLRHLLPARSAQVVCRRLLQAKAPARPADLDELHRRRVLAVDVNADHLACWVLDASGNPAGEPGGLPLELVGRPAYTRDGHLRTAISGLLHMARRRAAGRS